MKSPSPLDLPREPKNQLDFLVMLGFFRWFDVPFITGVIVGPVVVCVGWFWEYPRLIEALLVAILAYLMWLCTLSFRSMHFVIKNIGATKTIGFDAARIATSYLTGSQG